MAKGNSGITRNSQGYQININPGIGYRDEREAAEKLKRQQQAQAQQKQTQQTGTSLASSSADPYMDAYKKYEARLNSLRDAYRSQLMSDRDEAMKASQTEYDTAAKQNYINYMQAQKRLPGDLNRLGIRGGAAESSLVRLGTNYGSNVASNEAARNTALAALRQTYGQKFATYDEDYGQKLANAYATAVENKIALDQKNKELAIEQQRWQAEQKAAEEARAAQTAQWAMEFMANQAAQNIQNNIAKEQLKATKQANKKNK
jgi:hypothetical protein